MRRATATKFTVHHLNEEREQVAEDFIRIELELADTFCKLALESHFPDRSRQHRLNARKALDTALDGLTKVHMNGKDIEAIVPKIEEVKAMLESLERGGGSHPNC